MHCSAEKPGGNYGPYLSAYGSRATRLGHVAAAATWDPGVMRSSNLLSCSANLITATFCRIALVTAILQNLGVQIASANELTITRQIGLTRQNYVRFAQVT